jgi:hypothetical protein
MQLMFFWMLSPLDSSVAQTDWDNYLSYMAWTTILIILVGLAAILGLYSYSARHHRIHSPADLFRPYGPCGGYYCPFPLASVPGSSRR